MAVKELTVALYQCRYPRQDWSFSVDREALFGFLKQQQQELEPLGVKLQLLDDPSQTIDINGYGDLLNSIRLRSPRDGISNLCLGHIIGPSKGCDLLVDLRRGINRVAFAPEMIEPEDENRKVCHNCGCGC
jgi:hypothetical protein